MTKISLACALVTLWGVATATPAFACSCGKISTLQERLQTAPVVVMGRVSAVGNRPPEPGSAPGVTTVRPPFRGAGISLVVASVAKGDLSNREIRIWDLADGECFNALRELSTQTTVVVALWPVQAMPAAVRAMSGAMSNIPGSDYLTQGACGPSLKILIAEETAEWVGRKIP